MLLLEDWLKALVVCITTVRTTWRRGIHPGGALDLDTGDVRLDVPVAVLGRDLAQHVHLVPGDGVVGGG
jgi:hypothetical protein